MRFLAGLFILWVGACAPASRSPENTLTDIASDANLFDPMYPPGSNSVNLAAAAPTSRWRYDVQRDDVRNSEVRTASITSSNAVDFGPPYSGGSNATMTVRRHPEHGLDVIFSVRPSQMVCDLSDGCVSTINIDGRMQRIRLLMPADYDSEVLFVQNARGLLNQLRRGRRLIVELPFYQEGNRQFTFEIEGLEWE
jgi:hypothetical protein